MSMQMTVEGTLTREGTLVLDDKLAMPAGRVLVTVQPVVHPPPDDPFWQTMGKIWADQKARGHAPRTREEIDTEIECLRNESEEEIKEALRLHEECRQARLPIQENPQ